jgi:hypothetical protein
MTSPSKPPRLSDAESAQWFFDHSHDLFAVVSRGRLRHGQSGLDPDDRLDPPGADRPAALRFVHPDSAPGLRRDRRHDPRLGEAFNRLKVICKTGGWVWLEGTLAPGAQRRDDRRLRDVTADMARRAEIAAARQTRELLASSAGIGVWSYEPHGEQYRVVAATLLAPRVWAPRPSPVPSSSTRLDPKPSARWCRGVRQRRAHGRGRHDRAPPARGRRPVVHLPRHLPHRAARRRPVRPEGHLAERHRRGPHPRRGRLGRAPGPPAGRGGPVRRGALRPRPAPAPGQPALPGDLPGHRGPGDRPHPARADLRRPASASSRPSSAP